MGIFNRKTEVRHQIELDDETRQQLVSLENDFQAIEQLLREVVTQGRTILSTLQGQAFSAQDVQEFEKNDETWEPREMTSTVADEDRVRSSPFNRVPRHRQVAWLLDNMKDGVWYHAHQIAREHSGDEREYRYLRSAIGNRFREMTEEGLIERSPGTEKGSMFRYMKIPRKA